MCWVRSSGNEGLNPRAPRPQSLAENAENTFSSNHLGMRLDGICYSRHNRSASSEVIMLAYIFVLLAIASRFAILKMDPHPWMFTPVTASLLFFGARGPRRQWWIPLALFAAADVLLTRFAYDYPLKWDELIIWAWYGAMLWLGTRLRENARPLPVLGAALTGSVSFFVISNFAVWISTTLYPRTLEGLITCYAMAIPFFRKAITGDVLFTATMFAIPVLLHNLSGAVSNEHDHTAAA